ncbi:reverse transcriptase family protein [Proteus genomosp. 6]|uniref:RNA-directed DNA polymerase n=1 Tax=Proteus genomosp. 6 TaxID=1311820 RepID=A0ABV1LDF3_9GAMM
MKKITKKILLEQILNIKEEEIDDFIEKEISNIDVKEIKINNKFAYSLDTNKKLRKIQSNINDFLTPIVELNNSAIAYRKELSYFDFIEPHTKNYHFIRMDISSFFHSLDINDIKTALCQYVDNDIINKNHKQHLIDVIMKCITYTVPITANNENYHNSTILPMGFSTSPLISNLVFRKIDILIQKLCVKLDVIYTRYADDMLFSSPKDKNIVHSDFFIKEIKILISIINLKMNTKKTIIKSHTISLNGYVIQNKINFSGFRGLFNNTIPSEIRISNKKTTIIDKLIHYIIIKKVKNNIILKKLFNEDVRKLMIFSNKKKYIDSYSLDQILNKLIGYRSFLLSIIKYNKKSNITSNKTIQKYQDKIIKIEKCISIVKKKQNKFN